MNETWLRWKARIGALKGLALVLLIVVGAIFFGILESLNRVLKNPQGNQATTISQIATNQIETEKFITVSGLAAYRLSYQETGNGNLKAIIYPLIDQNGNYVIFVRTTHTELANAEDAAVKVSGMTQSAPSDLQQLIRQDMANINSAGLNTIDTLYVEEGREPGNLIVYLLEGSVLGFLIFLCIVIFFFPATVFGPHPVQPVTPDANVKSGIRAIGTLQQLKNSQPILEFGKSKRKFQNAVANLFTQEDKWIGVYIHFVYTQRVYGVQVSRRESDWAVIIKPAEIIALEPGKLYGWHDRWAISFRYRDANHKEQTLIVSFDHPAAQSHFVNYLREKGYPVSSGQYAVTGSTAWT